MLAARLKNLPLYFFIVTLGIILIAHYSGTNAYINQCKEQGSTPISCVTRWLVTKGLW